jgi:flagellar L-ring protein precursor FlgH
MRNYILYLKLFAVAICALTIGCTAPAKLSKLPEERDPIRPGNKMAFAVKATPDPSAEGSLWQNGAKMGSLFVDYKARSVGDIVTVSIVEDAQATNNAVTDTGKSSSVSAQVESLFGYENKYAGTATGNPFGKVSGGLESGFSGSGKTQRSGQLKAEITARVVGVLPNGNLQIIGTREITVNSERQFITLSGIIQPRDISSENKIASTRIADARIVYSGEGVIDEQQRQGWLSRALQGLWPL